MFSKSKHDEINQQLDMERIPNHMQLLWTVMVVGAETAPSTVVGHKQGMQTVKRLQLLPVN